MSTTVPLLDALAETQGRSVDLLEQIGACEERLSGLKQDLKEAQLEERVLKRVLARFGGEVNEAVKIPTTPTSSEPSRKDWAWKQRTDAVAEAVALLTQTEEFATPGSIRDFLADHNRDETKDVIGAALSYLRKAGRVQSHTRAQWIPASVPNAAQVVYEGE